MGFLQGLQRQISFSFFSLGRNSLQPVSYDFLPHSSSYLPRTWLEYLCGAEREAAVLCTPSLVHHRIFSTTVQYLPAGPHSALLFPSHEQTSLQGPLAWTGELLGAATISQYDLDIPVSLLYCLSSRGHQTNICSVQEGSLLDPFGFFMCLPLYFDVPDAAKGLGLRVRPVPPPCTGRDGQVICTESSLLFLLVTLLAKTLLFILLLIPADAETTFNFQPGSHPAMGKGHLCSTPRRDV